MKRIVFSLLLICSLNSFAREHISEPTITVLEIGKIFNTSYKPDIGTLVDYIDKEEKVSMCMEEYIKKQSKSYAKIAQENLYGLIHNFDGILSKIYGKKGVPDDIPYEEKVELLARVQCEAYYKIGALK